MFCILPLMLPSGGASRTADNARTCQTLSIFQLRISEGMFSLWTDVKCCWWVRNLVKSHLTHDRMITIGACPCTATCHVSNRDTQAGRYMSSFREFSDKFDFRHRSETPEIAIELSLQPWRAFGVDGVIMFSDILTPLPAMGIEFDVVRGKGPVIADPLRSDDQIGAVRELEDIGERLPFVGETLRVSGH